MENFINSFDNVQIYYKKSESKISDTHKLTLILLHGMGGDSSAWNDEVELFNKLGYDCIAVDLRGHGLSGRPDNAKSYQIKNFAKDILEIIKIEKLDKFILVGHCFGGMISIIYQALLTNSSLALILIDTSYRPPFFSKFMLSSLFLNKYIDLIINKLPNYHIKEHTNFKNYIGTGDYSLKRLLSDILHTSLKSYLLSSVEVINYDATYLLNSILVPTLVIEGKNDTIFPIKVAEDLKNRIVNSQLDIIKGANHILVINNPIDIVSHIHTYLTKII